MILIKFIFVPILAFDKSKYLGKTATKKIIRILPAQEIKTPTKKPITKKIVKKTPTKAATKKAPAKKVKTLIKKK